MPCGFDLATARADAECYARRSVPSRHEPFAPRAPTPSTPRRTSAVRPRLADGVELLAELLHPDIFSGASLAGRAALWAYPSWRE